jgi:2-(1,2-epoxy-1,2-dihydrophenyl)acetyl-CoA isomerase
MCEPYLLAWLPFQPKDGGPVSEILVSTDGGVATVTLNRPEVYNALTSSLRRELAAALSTLADDPEVRAVVLTGAGGAFCSGQDIRAFQDGIDVRTVLEEEYNPLVEQLARMPQIVIAAVNGPAAGAGMGLALACDVLLMADEAFLSCAFIRIGLVPDSGTVSTLVQAVGYQRALDIAITGRRVGAEEALAIGLVLETCPAADLPGRAAAMAAAIAGGPGLAIGLTKRLLRDARTQTLTEALDAEAGTQPACIASEDFREGITAFLEKRPAVFRGR